MTLTDEERAAIAVELEQLRREVDQLAATVRRRISRVAAEIGEGSGSGRLIPPVR
jgi:hypothetical protein